MNRQSGSDLRVDPAVVRVRLEALRDGSRRDIDEVADAVAEVSTSQIDPPMLPEVTLRVVEAGESAGLWDAARTVTALRGSVELPRFVTLRRNETTASRAPVGVPLRPEMSWAADTPLSESQRELVVAVNGWLRSTDGGRVPVAATAERAYEIVGDEKAFDGDPPRGGRTLWGDGRLNFELLRCERTPTPLTWEPAVGTLRDGPMLCVENHATFRTALRVLRTHRSPPWTTVAWVTGRNTPPLASLRELPVRVTRLDYLGDLDLDGLQIASTACSTAEAAGVAAGPADGLWEALLEQPSRPARSEQPDPAKVTTAVGWLPARLRDAAAAVLLRGEMIPQEALRAEMFRDAVVA